MQKFVSVIYFRLAIKVFDYDIVLSRHIMLLNFSFVLFPYFVYIAPNASKFQPSKTTRRRDNHEMIDESLETINHINLSSSQYQN